MTFSLPLCVLLFVHLLSTISAPVLSSAIIANTGSACYVPPVFGLQRSPGREAGDTRFRDSLRWENSSASTEPRP